MKIQYMVNVWSGDEQTDDENDDLDGFIVADDVEY